MIVKHLSFYIYIQYPTVCRSADGYFASPVAQNIGPMVLPNHTLAGSGCFWNDFYSKVPCMVGSPSSPPLPFKKMTSLFELRDGR